jgi:VanZ family protein
MRILSLTAALTWAALIWYLSDQPSIDITPVFEHQDKLLHIMAYTVLGFFTLGAMRAGTAGYTRSQAALAVLLASLYGLADEYHQSFVAGRDASALDLLADITGALLGVGLLFFLARQSARRASRIPT